MRVEHVPSLHPNSNSLIEFAYLNTAVISRLILNVKYLYMPALSQFKYNSLLLLLCLYFDKYQVPITNAKKKKKKETSLGTKTLLFEQVNTGLDTALSYRKSRYRFCGAEVF